jgi:hypothetical protein
VSAIVCLGWGSLIWNPRELPLADPRPEAWRDDGPELPIEFARVSSGGRLTLVIDAVFSPVRVLWNELSVANVQDAVKALRKREGTKTAWIGRWSSGNAVNCIDAIDEWARARRFAGVVWSAMPSKFHDQDYLAPTQAEAVEYLAQLEGQERRDAEEYVRKAPAQIDTPYRRSIEEALDWRPETRASS